MTRVERLRERLTAGAPLYPLMILFGLNTVDELDQAAFGVLLPNIRDSFGLNLTGILLLNTLIVPVSVGLGLIVAYYADRAKRVRMAAIGASVWALFSVLTGLVVNIYQMGIARIGASVGKSVNQPTHNSLLSDYYSVTVRPTVFAVYGSANQVGNIIAPAAAGFIALFTTWRVPFLLAGIPTMVLVFLALGLREPSRGVQDRLALGVSQQEAEQEETPPSYSEAWRILFAVRSLRRVYLALPFISASAIGMGTLMSLFYADVYGLNEAQRGVIASLSHPFSILGLAIGAPIAQRLMNRDPGLVVRFLGFSSVFTGTAIAVIALSPTVWVAIGASMVQGMVSSILLPGVYSVFSVAIPARARALGFVSSNIFLLPGLLFLPLIGAIGDAFGLRYGILLLIPLYLLGFMILGSSGKFLKQDVDMVRVSSMAEQEVRKALETGEPKLLLIRDLDVAYDQVQVLFGVNFDLKPGEIVALLGTNGAGKSTLLRAISGQVDPIGGAIYFDNQDITHVDPLGTFKAGIVQMPGGRSVFPTLSVEEHFRLASWMIRDSKEHVESAIEEVLGVFPRLRERWEQAAGNLSGGEQQMLGLSMSLIAKPKLLMIDELSLGLAPTIVEQLLDVVRRIHEQGTAIILVEQSVNVALTAAERAYFMEKGEVRFSGPTAELLERGDILRAVFLHTAADGDAGNGRRRVARTKPVSDDTIQFGAPALEVAHLTKSFGGIRAVSDVSFVLAHDEILGLIGPNGAGKTTIFDLVSGFLEPDAGTITFGGTDVTGWAPDRRARSGLGRSFQDARIFPSLTVAENLAVSLERHLQVRDPLADAMRLPDVVEQEIDVQFTVEQLIELMNLGAFRDKFVSELSTGSRRIVDLAMALAHGPSVLILDEPSSGIAQRETEALGPLLERIRREVGCAMLVIEHDMRLVTTVSNRMLALDLGAIIAQGSPDEVTQNAQVVSSYLGGDVAVIQRSGRKPARAGSGRREAPGRRAESRRPR